MTCSVCGTQNMEKAEFCKQCGSKLRRNQCPRCKVPVEPDAKFCSECGTRLSLPDEESDRTCQSCAFLNPAGTEYCKRCNQKLLR